MTDFDFTLGVCGPILSDTWPGDFECSFLDYDQLKRATVNSAVIRNKDVPYIRELLANLRPELREFMLETARLICEAGEGGQDEL